jgi:hypothetical protein
MRSYLFSYASWLFAMSIKWVTVLHTSLTELVGLNKVHFRNVLLAALTNIEADFVFHLVVVISSIGWCMLGCLVSCIWNLMWA